MRYLLLIFLFINIQNLHAGKWVQTRSMMKNETVVTLGCPDSNNCYCLMQCDLYTLLFRSNDQGRSWDTVYQSDPFNDGEPILVNVEDGSSPDPGHYYMAMYEDSYIKYSNDSGKTFNKLDIEPNKDWPVWEIRMLDSNVGIALCNGISITRDGWKTFEVVNNKPCGLHTPFFKNKDTVYFGMACVGQSSFIVYDLNTKIWSQVDLEPLCPVFDICFVNDSTGFIVSGKRTGFGDTRYDTMFRTKDGGKSWQKLFERTFEPAFGLQEISFKDEKLGIAVGQFGKIMRTTDGGDSWTYDSIPYEINKQIPPTMNIAWAGHSAIVGTYACGIWRYEEETGIKELPGSNSVKVRQESERLLISIEDANYEKYEVQITDIHGRLVNRKELNSGVGVMFMPVDISGLISGTYLFIISKNSSVVKTGKISIIK